MEMNAEKNRRVFIITAALLLAFIAAGLLEFTIHNGKRITRENQEYLLDNAERVAESIDNELSAGYDNIKILSSLVSKSLTAPEFDISDMQELIQNSVFDFMEFADRDGMDHNITGGVSDARDRQYYQDAKAGNVGMELIYVSRATHETLLMFYAPIYYEGEFVGSLVGVYQTANRITKLLTNTWFGESATAYLAADAGRIIAGSMQFDPENEMYVRDLAEGDPTNEAILQTALRTGKTVTFSTKENRTGGCMQKLKKSGWYLIQYFPQQASSRMIRNANLLGYLLAGFMALLYAAVIFTLVVFYRSQRKQVETARNQAEVASQAKTSFLFNMSHDIRTPMNAIFGYTDIALRHKDEPERVADSLLKIKTAGGHLLNLINDILEMSRIESGKMELSESPIDIREAINGVNQMSQSLAFSKDIAFSPVLGELRNPYVIADELHVNEIIINLISNAVKYTQAGGRVEYRAEQLGEPENGKALYRFTIRDNGIGMSEEFQKHLFESFSRERTATVSRQEGSGLGLSIVKRVVDLAGGTIQVKSRQGEGSTFTVELPFRVMDETAIQAFREEREKRTLQKPDIALEGRRVLLVEDNAINREIAVELLEESGLVTETAEDGAAAVRMVAENGMDYYDFILMDIQMPVMDGYQATAEIRRFQDGDRVPIIALSANAFKEDVDRSLEAGMNAHVAKPIDEKALFSAMHALAK